MSVSIGDGFGSIAWNGLVVGFDRAFLVAAGIALLMVVVALILVRVRPAEPGGS